MDLSLINVLSELERVEWPFEFADNDEVRCCCPFHSDKNPSCNINVVKGLFKCHTAGCKAKGDILTFLARVLKVTRRTIFEDLKVRYDLKDSKTIDLSVVERYHKAIWQAKPLLLELTKRGLNEKHIRAHRLGMFRGRITIPIFDEHGNCINIRRYQPGAPGPEKMRNTKGFGGCHLYLPEQLKFNTIVLCGGEIKAIVAASLLNKNEVGAVSATAGEGNWTPELNKRMKNKTVFVCYDIDKEGQAAAQTICSMLSTVVKWVGLIELPLDVNKYPHGDINDWVAEGATSKDFEDLLKITKRWVKYDEVEEQIETIEVHLSESVDAANASKRIEFKATIISMDTSPYVIPKRMSVHCNRNQEFCVHCPLYIIDRDSQGVGEAEIKPDNPAIIEMVSAPKRMQKQVLLTALKCPPCKDVTFISFEFYNVEDTRLGPQLEISNRISDHIVQPALIIGKGAELNESYKFTGRMFPHPKTQQSIILASEREAVRDALSDYHPSQESLDTLKIFQPTNWTSEALQSKLDEIYTDLEQNVTRIFQRRALHIALDLAWHSVLLVPAEKREVKGWVEVLVLGDSSQGKSEATARLMEHYGLGEKIEMKNATVAGILGGLHQLGNRWFVAWGTIPTHDKRLVVLEELKGASTEIIAKLTDMRSSGIAEIPKIQRRKTHARTRLIAISNPRSDLPLAAYNFGVDAVKELIGGLEDIRRFDLIVLLSAEDIDSEVIGRLQATPSNTEHIYTSDLSRLLILWAWTREDIILEDQDMLMQCALELCKEYSESIPIVDRGSMRFKLLRLATALACRTYSCDGNSVVVRTCHIEFITKFLRKEYSSRAFGYKRYSEAVMSMEQLLEPDSIRQQLSEVPFPSDFVRQILNTNEIELRDIQDWCAWSRDDAMQLLSFLVRKHAMRRTRNYYRKTPQFIAFLKAAEADLKKMDRPEFIGEY